MVLNIHPMIVALSHHRRGACIHVNDHRVDGLEAHRASEILAYREIARQCERRLHWARFLDAVQPKGSQILSQAAETYEVPQAPLERQRVRLKHAIRVFAGKTPVQEVYAVPRCDALAERVDGWLPGT